ncbi:MAG: GTPase ObgE [Verrucomicrobiota bacterium]
MFVDRIKIFAQGGNGGRGCVSFRREKFVPRGGPDGGDGGRGGDVILRADGHTDNLTALFYEPLLKAKKGGHGQGKKMHGRSALPKIVKVPVGTIVYPGGASMRVIPSKAEAATQPTQSARPGLPSREGNIQVILRDPSTSLRMTGQSDNEVIQQPITDLAHDGDEFELCRGGGGGKGNVHFKSSRNRAPREYTEGGEGESGFFLLELRTIADAGLVGYPNAGKSTLLSKVSSAHPKIASYPFTTLHPIIGVLNFPGYGRARIADIPGLIEGAHRNLGLGHDFLRHITRCQLLLFVLDMGASDGRHPVEDLRHLRREIDLYDKRLSQRPWRIIANKMDLPAATENLAALRRTFPAVEISAISAAKGEGIPVLKTELEKWLSVERDPNPVESDENAASALAE